MTGQLTATIAAVLKRGWLDSSQQERHAFFAEVEAAVAVHAGSAAARRVGVKILEVCAPVAAACALALSAACMRMAAALLLPRREMAPGVCAAGRSKRCMLPPSMHAWEVVRVEDA